MVRTADTATPSQCLDEAEGVLKVLDDPRFSAEANVRFIIKQIANMTFPPSQVLAVRIALLEFEKLL